MVEEQEGSRANDKRPRPPAERRPSPEPKEDSTSPSDYPRKRVNVACEVCRARKTRCDSRRPSCSFCTQSGARCSYRRTVLVHTNIKQPENSEHPSEGQPEVTPAGEQTRPVVEDSQEIILRLRHIEDLLENQGRSKSNQTPLPLAPSHNNEALGIPFSPSVTNVLPFEQRHNHPISEQELISEHALKGLSRIVGQALPEPLISLSVSNSEKYLETEIRRGEALLREPVASLQSLDLSPKTCWRLQQSFARAILQWCPFIDQEECARMATRTSDLQFSEHDLETALTLFVLSLGEISKQDYRGDAADGFKGLDYFQVACSIICQPQHSRYSIIAVQCRILMACYYLFCLRPLQAFNALHEASLAVLALLQCKSRLERNPQLKEQVLRAYWTCYLLEHELQGNISYSSCLLQLQNEFVPLPLFDHDEPGGYWFLSEIAFRKIFSNSRDGFGWNAFMLHRTKVVQEIILQLQQWYDYLPGQIKFPMNVAPLMDSHKVFLRAQYFAVVGTLHWSFVVRLLTTLPQDEKDYAVHLEAGAKCLDGAVMHVHAVEPLLQERHLMLAANITGLHCCVNLLLCAYNVPVLTSIQHPEQAEAIHKGRNLLANWASSPVVAVYVERLDALMMAKGLIVMSPRVAFSPRERYRVS